MRTSNGSGIRAAGLLATLARDNLPLFDSLHSCTRPPTRLQLSRGCPSLCVMFRLALRRVVGVLAILAVLVLPLQTPASGGVSAAPAQPVFSLLELEVAAENTQDGERLGAPMSDHCQNCAGGADLATLACFGGCVPPGLVASFERAILRDGAAAVGWALRSLPAGVTTSPEPYPPRVDSPIQA